MRPVSRIPAVLVAVSLLAGCQQAPVATPVTEVTTVTPASASPVPSPTPTPTPSTVAPTPAATSVSPTPTSTEPTQDSRKGKALNQPYTVNGIPVVSKKHRISKSYKPADPAGSAGLERKVNKALNKMIAAARADGVTVVVRSGYRSYATQAAIYARQLKRYPSKELARRYNAPAGGSEHQTGLSVDLWDGSTWGLAMARTKAGKWLAKHAREYGFILRYPDGGEKITGYAYEPWHFRWVGTEHSLKFKANSGLTLEEYLGID